MRKQTPQLEWRIVENDEEWERQQAHRAADVAPLTGPRRTIQKHAGNIIALLLLLVMVGAWWRTSQAGNQQKGVSATVAAPPTADAIASSPTSIMESIDSSQGNYATQPWLLGVANSKGEQSLATPYFIYHFHWQDAAIVRAVAPQMDQLYITFWLHLGLPISPIPNRLVVMVKGAYQPGQSAPSFDTQQHIMVPSPMLYPAPVKQTSAERLAQSIALPLLHAVVAQAEEHYHIQAGWQPLLNGLYLWQVWDTDLPLSTWRETVVKWQYIDLPAAQPGQAFPLPTRYQALCADHKLWLPSLARIHFPLVCAGREWEDKYWDPWRAGGPLTRLEQLLKPARTWDGGVASLLGPPFSFNHPGQTVALATLIEYTGTTYGRDRLPALLAGLGQYDRWDTLLPAVFGVSAAEFEAGWQRYLAEHYGVVVPK